ncbi:MAG: phosphocholine cytidylyltransferase family protein [bacterium]
MKAIILAAGQGTRLKQHTKSIPKCLVRIKGRTLLSWQLDAIRKCGIKQIIVIKGYKAGKIKYKNVKYYTNKNFAQTNMVRTLFCAAKELTRETIVSYGDIIYSEEVLRALIRSKADISVVVDTKWQGYWKKRAKNHWLDAESLILGENNRILEIGQKPATKKNTQAQYIGLIKFSRRGLQALKKIYVMGNKESKSNNDLWKTGRKFEELYFTDILQKLIRTGQKVTAVPIKRGWFEIDTIKDIRIASTELK